MKTLISLSPVLMLCLCMGGVALAVRAVRRRRAGAAQRWRPDRQGAEDAGKRKQTGRVCCLVKRIVLVFLTAALVVTVVLLFLVWYYYGDEWEKLQVSRWRATSIALSGVDLTRKDVQALETKLEWHGSGSFPYYYDVGVKTLPS